MQLPKLKEFITFQEEPPKVEPRSLRHSPVPEEKPAVYTVSPYTQMHLTATYPAPPRRVEDLAAQNMDELNKCMSRLEMEGMPTSLVILRRGLMPAPERSVEECKRALPKPGATFQSDLAPPLSTTRGKSRTRGRLGMKSGSRKGRKK